MSKFSSITLLGPASQAYLGQVYLIKEEGGRQACINGPLWYPASNSLYMLTVDKKLILRPPILGEATGLASKDWCWGVEEGDIKINRM